MRSNKTPCKGSKGFSRCVNKWRNAVIVYLKFTVHDRLTWGNRATRVRWRGDIDIFCRRTWCDKSEISFDERNSLRYSEPIEFEKENVTRKLIVVETMRFVYCRILRRAWGGEARLFRRVNQSFVIYWYRIEFRSYALTFHIYNWPFVIRASILFSMSDMVMLQI